MQTRGYYYQGGTNPIYATPVIYHTLGWANEYEQGSGNSMAEPWEYFPFNDRDFTSVAELMLVPGCSPGLFTKQFVEFSSAAGNVTSIFNAVTPTSTPPTAAPVATIVGAATTQAPPGYHRTHNDGNQRVDSSVQHRLVAVFLCVRYELDGHGGVCVDCSAAILPLLERRVLLFGVRGADHA